VSVSAAVGRLREGAESENAQVIDILLHMHTAIRRLHGATFLIVGALALTATACDSKTAVTSASSSRGPSPTASASGLATAEATPTPEVTDPAEKAARTYFETLNAAIAAMNEAKLLPLMSSGCECRELADHIKKTRREGKRIDASYTIVRSRIVKKGAKQMVVELRYDLTKEVVRDKSGKVVKTAAAVRNGVKRVTLAKSGSRWLVTHIVTVST